jgi:prevent-host-death family protein
MNRNRGDLMSIREEIRPVSYLKSRAADLLGQINETRRAVVITQNGEPRGVLQDPASYEQMREAIGLLKLLVQGEEDYRRNRVVSSGKLFSGIRERLEDRKD